MVDESVVASDLAKNKPGTGHEANFVLGVVSCGSVGDAPCACAVDLDVLRETSDVL